jgi:hypothetical protein
MRTAITAACSLALAASLGLATAHAADPGKQATPASTASSATSKSDPSQASSKLAANEKPGKPQSMIGGTCLKSTGSRVPVKKGHCEIQPGVVYTQRQLRTTGETDTASALRDLSPILGVHH